MAMTTNPPPCEPPGQLLRRAVEVVDVVLERRVHDRRRGSGRRCRCAMPTRSMTRKRTPRSRTKWRVPWVRLASHGAPMKPIQRPSRVETTYHSGGTDAVAMACICAAVLPGDGAGDEAEDQRADLADQEADDGVDEPHPALALGLRGDPRRIEEGDVAGGQHRGRGRQHARRWGRRPAAAAVAAARREAASTAAAAAAAAAPLDPFAGHVPGRDGPRRAGPGGPAGRGPPRRARYRSSARRYRRPQRPPPAGRPLRRRSDGAVTTDQGRRLAWKREPPAYGEARRASRTRPPAGTGPRNRGSRPGRAGAGSGASWPSASWPSCWPSARSRPPTPSRSPTPSSCRR